MKEKIKEDTSIMLHHKFMCIILFSWSWNSRRLEVAEVSHELLITPARHLGMKLLPPI